MSHDRRNSLERGVSGFERLWLVADRLWPPFVNQMVLEGEGHPDPSHAGGWDAVIRAVTAAQPAGRARLRGCLSRMRWVADGPQPGLRELRSDGWDGCGPDGADFLRMPLSPQQGPTCEFVVVRGETTRVVVRTHHALMDGQGTLLLARALFAALRGEEPPAAVLGPLNDQQLAREIGASPEKIPGRDCVAPTGAVRVAPRGVTWCRHRVEGRFGATLPRLAVALESLTVSPPGVPVRVDIPVDMRRHRPDLQSSANLTGILRLSLDEHRGSSDPVARLSRTLKEQLARGEYADLIRASEPARYVPLGLMAWVGRLQVRRSLAAGRFGATAVLSNLGRLDLEQFSGGGFRARRSFFIPPGNPGLPLFLGISGDEEGVELCATAPESLATDGRLRMLLEQIGERMRETVTSARPATAHRSGAPCSR